MLSIIAIETRKKSKKKNLKLVQSIRLKFDDHKVGQMRAFLIVEPDRLPLIEPSREVQMQFDDQLEN